MGSFKKALTGRPPAVAKSTDIEFYGVDPDWRFRLARVRGVPYLTLLT